MDGYYYYIRSTGVAARNQSYWVSTTNGLLPAALYDFDEQGRLLDPPVICSTNPDGTLRNGVYTDEDGEIRYYVDGVPTNAGLIYWEGYYYYFTSYAKAVRSQTYWISNTNGLMEQGSYTFDDQGRMTNPPEDALTEAAAVYSNGVSTYDTGSERTLLSTTVIQYSYVYNGGQLVQMTIDTTTDSETATRDTLYFAYDASGTPMSVTYNDTVYYYATNLQGDIVAILDTTGTAVVQYSYDAWGNPLSTTGTLASTLGEANPLRYRGYVYDTETELYYLQSRYYSPTMGRFINADTFVSTGQGIIGNNMFAYCGNNPAMRKDIYGKATIELEIAPDGTTLSGEEKYHYPEGTVTIIIEFTHTYCGGIMTSISNVEVSVTHDTIELVFPDGQAITFNYDYNSISPDTHSSQLFASQDESVQFSNIVSEDGIGVELSVSTGNIAGSISIQYKLSVLGALGKWFSTNASGCTPIISGGGWTSSSQSASLGYSAKFGVDLFSNQFSSFR